MSEYKNDLLILAIETSCDDTAAAVVRGRTVLSNVISSQTVHDQYGGIIPELASREHIRGIAPIVVAAVHTAGVALEDIDAIAVTYGPGLAGSLVVGTQFAKALSLRLSRPVIPVHHIEAHVYSGYLEDDTLPYPSVCLVASGGHTSIFHVRNAVQADVIGSTRDDAAGEAFDKVAKMLGLGYPGGPHVDRLSKLGNAMAYDVPRGLMHDRSYDFSFSGLKTAVRRIIEQNAHQLSVEDVCASTQRSIVDVLVHKTMQAALDLRVQAVCIAGGVSANSELREAIGVQCRKRGLRCVLPRATYSVDNAAMIGFRAAQRLEHDREQGRPFAGAGIDFAIEPNAIRARAPGMQQRV